MRINCNLNWVLQIQPCIRYSKIEVISARYTDVFQHNAGERRGKETWRNRYTWTKRTICVSHQVLNNVPILIYVYWETMLVTITRILKNSCLTQNWLDLDICNCLALTYRPVVTRPLPAVCQYISVLLLRPSCPLTTDSGRQPARKNERGSSQQKQIS
jgi:hypothetical protein